MSPNDVELIYELSPMQQAMLFHSLLDPGSGVYVIQMSLRLTGRLDLSAFDRAWERVVERHAILRTAFFWEGLEKPLQVVYRQSALAVRRESWRGVAAADQRARLARFLDAERARGFDLGEAPLLRISLFELEAGVHQMVWTIHHLLVDGWSQGQLLRELFTGYAAYAQGAEPKLAPAGRFRDYIAWLQRQDPEAAEAYWRRSLAGFTAPTLLAGAESATEGPSWRSARRRDLPLPGGVASALREAARRHRLTLNTLVQGAWSLLLAQASGREDVVFGTTVAGRPADLPGVESTLGLFINSQPVRVEVRPEQRLWDWLAALQERQVEMRRYEHSSLVDVQRWSELPAGTPLFDHLLVFENVGLPAGMEKPLPGLEIAEEAAQELTNYPLNVVVIPGVTGLLLTLRYDGGRFTDPEAGRLLERLARLLRLFAEDRDLALGDVPLLLPAEQHQAVVEWNDTARTYEGKDASLHALIARQAERTPDAVAAADESGELTYRELVHRARALARQMTRLGVEPDGRVGVLMERSLEMIVGLLGTLEAGAAYVPLDPTWPAGRLATLIESSGARVVLAQERWASTLNLDPDRLLVVPPLPGGSECVWERGSGGEGLAYVLFTSGSTGTPKGVMIPHRGIVNRLLWMQEAYGLTPADRVLQKTPFSFDVSLWEFFWPLLTGARLVFAKPEGHKDPAYLAGLIAREQITTLHFVPSMLQAFLEAPGLEALTSVRRVMASGEALPPELVRRFFARLPHAELHNLYGPTEASVDVSFWAAPVPPSRIELVPIGRPIANLRLHVMDHFLRPVPIGVAGELLLGGVGLARGYLGRPDLTAAAFVPDPCGAEAGGRLYRTGDLTRFLPDGNVEYLGRIDTQVKIRGFRIELGEIEAVLAALEGVREVAVVARGASWTSDGSDRLDRSQGDLRLVAYVAGHASAETLRSALRARLPDYMVPSAFVVLDAFPLTTSGKVDRKALPAPEAPRGAADYIPPADPVEERVAEIWGEVLGAARVGARDNFFDLGGHSLLATQVASRLREAFGVEIPLRSLFEAPTVAALAERIDAQAAELAGAEELDALLGVLETLADPEAQARLDDPRAVRELAATWVSRATEAGPAGVPAYPLPRPRPGGGGAFPLSYAQQRLWFLDQLEPASPAYNIPLPVRLHGELPVALLARIAGEIVRRHETLRTTFAARDGEPVQVVWPEGETGLPVVDLSALPDPEAPARSLAQAEALRPFDLAAGPLLRLTVVRLAARDHLLLITLHHIVSDGWSMQVLLREVAALFAAFGAGAASPLPAPPFQYADFALWQRRWLQAGVLEEQLAFWKSRLAGAPQVLELPTDRPRPAIQSYRGAAVVRTLGPAVAAAVRELCRRSDVTPFMALLAAWGVLLGRHAAMDDLLIGTPVAGRHVRGTEHLIGFFANTLALRVELGGAPSFADLLRRVRQTALDAFSHQDLPFERLVEELVPARDLSRSPLFQAMFVLQDARGEGWRMPGFSIEPVELAGATAKFDVLLTLAENADGFAANLEHSTDLFDADRMARLLQGFEVLLTGAAAAPETPVAALPLLTPEERERVLYGWNDNAVERPRRAVHEPVEEQAARTPDALAAVWAEIGSGNGAEDGAELTYRELNARANQLAHHLRALGVGPDARVSICLERSLDLPVAVLGVLKAGGAYVPIDPDYPADRVAFMLADSRSRVLVTSSAVASRLPDLEAGVHRVLVDTDRDAIAARRADDPVRWTAPENLAYVIYTSGSTGWPKGVAMPHGVLANFLAWEVGTATAGTESRTLQFASLSFDVSFQEIFTTWWTGGALVGIDLDTRRDAEALCRVLGERRVTRLFLPFVALQQLAEVIDQGAPLPAALREIVTAGEQLQITRQIAAWLERSDAFLENHYGPSEGHVVTVHRLTGHPARWPALPPIGRPLPNVRMYLLDPSFAPVPQGVPGHLYFGGAQVVRGYLDRPELTAEKFLPDPFGPESGGRLYATGDLARFLEGGVLQYEGRVDQQVKIRGYRVEPGEVESALARHPAVREAAVVVRGTGTGRRLVGYYVAGEPLAADELRAVLRAELPEYMVPAVLVPLDALPTTPSGKLDRRALPAPPDDAAESAGYMAPSGPVEELLARIWAEVLGRGRVGAHDDFFALGGHSLLATQVVSRVRGALGAEIPVRQLFETPTVAGFARAVRAAGPGSTAPPILPVPRDRALPLSFAQQRLWLIDRIDPGSAAYNVPLAVRLTGEVPPGLIERIFVEIGRRHEVLRTTFDLHEGRPVQVIAATQAPDLPRVDLAGLRDRTDRTDRSDRAAQEALRLAREEAGRPFDLRRGPLLRLALARLGAREHLLFLTLHHIVTDGWSFGVLLREIAALWEAFAAGRPSPLPDLPVQYADFAVWQRTWLQGEVLEAQLAFWRGALAGAPQVLELPTDRPRPPVQTTRGGAQPVAVPPALSAALSALCRRRGVTPFMALLAAWSTLLGRLANQDDLLIGTPIAGRNRRETEELIGFFVNTLPLRVQGLQATFDGLLGRVRETTLDTFAHQDLPFERLVEELVPERDPSRPPLVQVLFVLQNAPAGALEIPGLTLAPVDLLDAEGGTARFDLLLALAEGEGGISGVLEHNADLFDPSTAERLAARFVLLLEGAVAAPETALADLPLLLPSEREQVLSTWNATATGYPREASLPELFETVARERPDAPAIVDAEGTQWSYRRLHEAAARLAGHLRSLGAGPETPVGLCLERSPGLIVATLAIVAAGGYYVPLDSSYPDERLAFMLADTGAGVVLVEEATRERIAGLGVGGVLVEIKDDKDSNDNNDSPETHASLESLKSFGSFELPPEGLAYVTYTSGSTGRPKGVAVTHRAVVRLVRGTDYVRLGPGDRTAHAANISFDAATWEIWGALLNGAAVVIVPRDTVLAPQAFVAALRERRVTSLFLTTALFSRVAAEVPGAFESVRDVMFGGEAVDPAAPRKVLAQGPPQRLLNVYGPTESTTFATWHPVLEVAAGAANVPIGQPIANTILYVLDRAQGLAAPGSAGELCLGGDGLARGYLGRPELTAERFVPHPWGRGERLYRTGDLVRRRPDGPVEYLGRLDDQVKIRGFRIEPGEIETVLAGHPAVRACAVLARRDDPRAPGEIRLVAYAVLDPEAAIEAPKTALRAWLQERLPDYMVPAAWVVLDALPLTANGKLDRRALPAPERESGADEGQAAPSDAVEAALAAIWCEVLRIGRVGLDDDFFVLGGHSLLVTQVATRVREVLGLELPLRRVFDAPTIRQLAEVVRAARPAESSAPVPLGDLDAAGLPPLSFAQQRLWILDQLEPGNPVYNVPLVVRLSGELSADALARAFAEVVRRHEALRTTFAVAAGQPVQVIAPPESGAPELMVLDLSTAPPEEREEWTRELVREEARTPFDLERGPLVRLGLVRLAAEEHLMLTTLHHIVADGWSLGVLLREIATLYAAFLRGEPSPLPELPLQYGDFARWQRGWLQGAVLEEQLGYWTRKLAGAPALLELPTDRPRPAAQTFGGASVGLSLPPALSAALHELGRREGVTPFMLLLAAWALLLARHAGQDDVVLGTPIAGRNRREIEDLIGFFVNTLALRVELGDGLFTDLLAQVRATALEAFTYQDLPFERIVEEIAPERDLAHAPLFQVLFALQNAPGGEGVALPGLSLAPVGLDAGVAKFDLSLSVWEGAEGFTGALEHNTDLFDGATAERLLDRFQVLLEGVVEEPGRSVWELPLLLDGERRQVLVEPEEPPRAATIPELFAARVAANPGAPAVVFTGEPAETLSYADLDERSAAWARELCRRGVGPETRVGLCVRRSPRMVVGLLAVLRAGGAYVPLDPAWPAERLAWMLDDAGVDLVLAEEATAGAVPGERTLLLLDEVPPPPGGCECVWDPAHAAYVIYTSGSTGRPKGVVAHHGGLAAFSQAFAEAIGLRSGDRVLQFASLSFDASAVALYPPLLRGAAIVLHPEPAALTPGELVALSEEQGLTALELPAALWRLVAREAASAGLRFGPAVRLFLTGGESLNPEALRQWGRSVDPAARLVSSYGPTEATVVATVHLESGSAAAAAAPAGSPLGRALRGTGVYLLDRRLFPVPLDVPGEIFLGGAGVTRGYLGRPELTAAAFLPDPWGEPGARLYRTGDRARRRPDGALEFLGRVDEQLKIRGFRIEPGEIEAALAAHPQVREALVLARASAAGDLRLVGYVTLRESANAGAEELRSWLRERLPEHLVPGAWVVLDAFPLAPTGKVDRKALPAPEGRDEAAFVAPGDPLEERLAAIWREVLGLDRIGIHDNFFTLGGHSLLATQVVTRVREAFGVNVPLRRLFQTPTVAELARGLREEHGSGIEAPEPVDLPPARPEPAPLPATLPLAAPAPRWTAARALSVRLAGLSPEKRQLLDAVLRERRAEPSTAAILSREDRRAPAPLSFSQERMWFLHQLDPRSAVYNIFLGVRLDGALRSALLAAAFRELARRHEILATRYELAGERPVQVVAADAPVPLPRVDLANLPEPGRTAELDRLQTEEAARPFDLVHGPVLRVTLVRLAPAEHVLLLTVHHIALDGWSLRILLDELAALYAAFAAGAPSPLPAPALQYADYAAWQRERLQGEALEAERAWWRRQLAPPLPLLALPTDAPRQVPQPFRLATEDLAFPAGLTADLHALAAGRGASLFMLLLAGLATVLHRTGGDERVLVGTPVAGRNRREVEGLVGDFLNTLILRVDLAGDPDFADLLEETARTALEAFAHQDLPLELLLQELRLDGEGAAGARGPFQVLLLVQNLRRLRIEVPGLTLTGRAAERQADLGTAVFELGLTVEEHGGELQASMSYNAMLFEAATLQRLLGHLRALLAGAVEEPAARLSGLPLLTAAERAEVAGWNLPVPAPSGTLIPALFAAQAAHTPDAEAIRHGARHLTYGELAARSRGLAARLHALGVGPETPVAVFLERSPALIAALLGVLHAGGVYAPLDPVLPAERLAWVLEDLAPAVLITGHALAGRIPWTGRTLLVEDEIPDEAAPFPPPEAAQGAYILYTSGSTGRPKGVVVSHGAMASFVAAARELYGFASGDRVLQFASLGFDTSVEEIYPCLTTGGTLVLRSDEMAGSIAAFLDGCAEQGITVLDLPTAFWHELAVSPELAERGLPATVRAVILGGERPLPERVAEWLRREDLTARLFNTYGPTESTVVATAAELTPALIAESWREVPMGRPIRGVQAHVADGGGQPVPVGVPGELLLGGLTLARGYLGRPGLTAERFVPNPFSGTAGARLYRTGDLARRRADGSLEFAGRVDQQVKIRGFRVEPGEVESVLAASADVAECAVVAREDGPRGLRLVAYVVPRPERDLAGLRAFLEARLPAWMVPAVLVPLPALPRTPTGKIDRRALPAPDGPGLTAERPRVAPRNEIEEAVAEIWSEALGLEELSVFDSFFELGGNSLLLLQVMRRLRETFDLEVPLRSVYEERTVAALAKKVEELLIAEISELA